MPLSLLSPLYISPRGSRPCRKLSGHRLVWHFWPFFFASCFHLDFWSFFDPIFNRFGSQNGSQNRLKIDKKSIQKSILFLIPFWRGKNKKKSSSWELPSPKKWGTPHAKTTFSFFHKMAFLIDFGRFWAPFGEVLGPQIGTFWWPKINQNFDQFLNRFFIDFGAILGPKMDPKSTQKFDHHWPWGCFLGSWSQLGTPRGSKRVLEPQKPPQSDLRDLFFDVFGLLFW